MNNSIEVWDKILSSVKDKIPAERFDIWIKPIKPISVEDSTLILQFPNVFFKDWFVKHFRDIIEKELSDTTNSLITNLELTIDPKPELEKIPVINNEEKTYADYREEEPSYQDDFSLNSKYTFESFVPVPSNRFAHAAAIAVSEAPAKAYNPFFIYGGVGLGKTHLLHAIGTYAKKKNPSTKVVYVTSEKFMNEMISAMRFTKMLEFKEKYRNVDVLLIDDIQFLEGKTGTQEEFFHTFNALYESNKQIVATSDSHPKEINLEARLQSRFEMGLIADIKTPTLEDRTAILSAKADQEKLNIPKNIVIFIANKIPSNIRVLQGALIKISAYASLTNSKITEELAEEVLSDLIIKDKTDDKKAEDITIDKIKKVVVEYFGLKPNDMIIKKRTHKLSVPRQIAMYLARELTESSLPEIGDNFGKRDHTTVMHAYDTVKDKIENDKNFASQIKQIIDIIKET